MCFYLFPRKEFDCLDLIEVHKVDMLIFKHGQTHMTHISHARVSLSDYTALCIGVGRF